MPTKTQFSIHTYLPQNWYSIINLNIDGENICYMWHLLWSFTWLHICIFAFLKLRAKILSILVRKPFCRRFALQRGLWFTTRHSISVAGVIKQCELHVDAVILFLWDQQKPLYGQFYSRKMNTHFKSKTNSLPSFNQSNYGYLGSCFQISQWLTINLW